MYLLASVLQLLVLTARLCYFHSRLLLPRLRLQLLFRDTMYRNRTGRINRGVRDPSNFEVILVLRVEGFPMLDSLQKGVSLRSSPEMGRHTSSSLSSKPRKSCVRWSLKHPVPNARAASTPALNYGHSGSVGESPALT